jgi:hypothetical protein
MRRKLVVVVLSSVVGSFGLLGVTATPALASCQTNPDVGDICKAIDVIERAVCNTKPGQYLADCS